MKKIICFLTLFLMLMTTGCGRNETISVNNSKNDAPSAIVKEEGSQFVKELYNLRGTNIADKSNISHIINKVPFFKGESYELESFDSTLKITYKTDLRTRFRNNKELNMNMIKLSLTLFTLVEGAEKTEISIEDIYGNFYNFSFYKNKMSEMEKLKYFTEENFKASVKKKKNFEDFLMKIIALKFDKDEYEGSYEEIYKKLSDEVVIKDLDVYELIYKPDIEIKGFDIEKYAKENGINLSKYEGVSLKVFVCEEENFINKTAVTKAYFLRSERILFFGEVTDKEAFISSVHK